MDRSKHLVLVLVPALGVVLGCGPKGSPKAATTQTTAAGAPPSSGGDGRSAEPPRRFETNEAAADALAAALCDHAAECEEIGRDRPYSTAEDCSLTTRRRAHRRLDTIDCPLGLGEQSLAACVTAIRAESCGYVIDDPVAEIRACRPEQLCMP